MKMFLKKEICRKNCWQNLDVNVKKPRLFIYTVFALLGKQRHMPMNAKQYKKKERKTIKNTRVTLFLSDFFLFFFLFHFVFIAAFTKRVELFPSIKSFQFLLNFVFPNFFSKKFVYFGTSGFFKKKIALVLAGHHRSSDNRQRT